MGILFSVLPFALGFLLSSLIIRIKTGGLEKLAQTVLHKAENDALRKKASLEIELQKREFEHRCALEKLTEAKEKKLSRREEKLEKQAAEIEKTEKELQKQKKDLLARQKQIDGLQKDYAEKLEKLSSLSSDQAREMMIEQFHASVEKECAAFLNHRKQESDEKAEAYAMRVITTAINRLSHSTVSDVSVVTVSLPSHEMKGRVIGREGRNIRVLEETTGMNFIIDDTPNAVVISGFDPLRKEIARQALTELVQDGRIHPTHIEQVVEKTRLKVQKEVKNFGEEAAIKARVLHLHPEIILLLGKLHFRHALGQNLLDHSLEVCRLMEIMASELRLDSELAKRIGLLHDIGKAAAEETEGSHALIGQQIALENGESEEVANGIGSHHNEILPLTFEASLCSAADAISSERPGSRLEALEHYLKRSSKLEKLAKQFKGVEQAYAMHAGKEIRVLVEPEFFDDRATLLLSREIAQKIEKEMSYPGKIKVTVIREKKAVEYAN